MQTITCDVCLTNDADKRFKVKMQKEPFEHCAWKNLDICHNCYNKLIKAIPEKPKSSLEIALENIGRTFSNAFSALPADFQSMRENATDEPEPPDEG